MEETGQSTLTSRSLNLRVRRRIRTSGRARRVNLVLHVLRLHLRVQRLSRRTREHTNDAVVPLGVIVVLYMLVRKTSPEDQPPLSSKKGLTQ